MNQFSNGKQKLIHSKSLALGKKRIFVVFDKTCQCKKSKFALRQNFAMMNVNKSPNVYTVYRIHKDIFGRPIKIRSQQAVAKRDRYRYLLFIHTYHYIRLAYRCSTGQQISLCPLYALYCMQPYTRPCWNNNKRMRDILLVNHCQIISIK